MLILKKSDQTGLIGPSRNLWKNCPILDILEDPTIGVFRRDMFDAFPPHASTGSAAMSGALGDYMTYLHQGSAIVPAGAHGGGLKFTMDGNDEGAALGPYVAPLQIAKGKGKLWFEACVKTSIIDNTKHGFFLGLLEGNAIAAGVPITTAGVLADKNLVGFHRLEGDGDALDAVYKADGQTAVTVKADAAALAANTWINLGLYYDESDLYFYVDGEPLGDKVAAAGISAAAFPNDVLLGPVFAVMSGASSGMGDSSIRFWQYAQLHV